MNAPPIQDGQRLRDEDHLNLLSIFHFVIAGLSLFGILFLCLHYFLMSTVFNNPEMWKNAKNATPPPAQLMSMMVWFYAFMGFVIVTAGVLNAVAGYFLRKRKHRIFCLVVAGLDCLQIPFGTMLGVFTIIILSRESVRMYYPD